MAIWKPGLSIYILQVANVYKIRPRISNWRREEIGIEKRLDERKDLRREEIEKRFEKRRDWRREEIGGEKRLEERGRETRAARDSMAGTLNYLSD